MSGLRVQQTRVASREAGGASSRVGGRKVCFGGRVSVIRGPPVFVFTQKNRVDRGHFLAEYRGSVANRILVNLPCSC